MGMLTKLFGLDLEQKQVASMQDILNDLSAAAESDVRANSITARKSPTTQRSIKFISETVASLPLVLYRRDEKGKHKAKDHPLFDLLKTSPTPLMTSYQMREKAVSDFFYWGNAYLKKSTIRGQVRELNLLTDVRVERQGHDVFYVSGGERYTQDQIVHFRDVLKDDGLTGEASVLRGAGIIGREIVIETFADALFKNGATIGGILRFEGKLGDEAFGRLRKQWEDKYGGAKNAHKTAIVEEGGEFQKISQTAEEAQLLDARKFGRGQIAAHFGVPPHKVGAMDNATFSNIEHQAIEWVVDAIVPLCVRLEQQMEQSLLTPKERKTYFIKHEVDGLLRGDFKTRMEGYGVGVDKGFMTRNEVREKEDMNPIEGLDEPLLPLNMAGANNEQINS